MMRRMLSLRCTSARAPPLLRTLRGSQLTCGKSPRPRPRCGPQGLTRSAPPPSDLISFYFSLTLFQSHCPLCP